VASPKTAAGPSPKTAATPRARAQPTPAIEPAVVEPSAAPATPEPTAAPLVAEGTFLEPGPGVIPPRKISGNPVRYPDVAQRLRLQGAVRIEAVITEGGEPAEIHVLESAGDVLDKAVVDAVRRWRFEPATKDGVKVRTRWQFRWQFRSAN
jgi:protein TonB